MRFLMELHAEMNNLYRGNLAFIKRQDNLTPNVLDKYFRPTFDKIYQNHNTQINFSNLQTAQTQVEDLKLIAQRKIQKFQENLAQTESLLASTQEINMLAKDFEKGTREVKTNEIAVSWWMGSR